MFTLCLVIGLGLAEAYHFANGLLTRDQRPQILGRQTLDDGTTVVELLSARYDLNEVFISMRGPYSNQSRIPVVDTVLMSPSRGDDEKIVYVTGVKTDLIDTDSGAAISPEFFCHSNLTLSPSLTTPEQHNQSFATEKHLRWRLFTLVPGKMEIQLPEGFGIPMKSDSTLDYLTMALNQNPGMGSRSIRMKSQVFLSSKPLKPLFFRALMVHQKHIPDSPGTEFVKTPGLDFHANRHPGELCVESCDKNLLSKLPSLFEIGVEGTDGVQEWHPGLNCCVENASVDGILPDQFGTTNTIHWMVPPGQHRFRTEVTGQLDLPFDTTAHYITGHLHTTGTCLKLVELDSQEVIFEITGKSRPDRLGVLEMSEIHHKQGVLFEQGKRYELIADYNNTWDKPIDAMAIMCVYFLDEPGSPDYSLAVGR